MPAFCTPTPGVMDRPVHVVASPFKTGSTSIGTALIELGVGQARMPYNGQTARTVMQMARPLNRLVVKGEGFAAFREKHSQQVIEAMAPAMELLAPYDVFDDAPFGHNHIHPFVRKIIAPQAHFIWVNRPLEDWLDSVRRWELSHPQVYKNHQRWITAPDVARRARIKMWKKSYSGFKRVRRNDPRQCVELEWADLNSYDALAGYYQVEPPKDPFPHRNINTQ